jgi:hypothetical protein
MSDPRPDAGLPPEPSLESVEGVPGERIPGERPPRRLLGHAPAERFAVEARSGSAPAAPGAAGTRAGSRTRALALGAAAAAGGAALHLVAATLLLWTSGLLVVAVTLGIVVGLAVAVGAGGAVPAGTRRVIAVGLALGGLAGALAVDWGLSGMYLGPVDYLAQVYGAVVPVETALAVAGALAGSR